MYLHTTGKYGIVRVLSCSGMDPICDLLALACSYKVNFDTEDGFGEITCNFKDSFVS